MKDKKITLEEYQEAGEEFWPKYWYVAKELGENSKPEQVLKVIEALAGIAMKNRVDKKVGPFGFNKNGQDSDGKEESEAE